ncbi:hypothetical protein ILUMI_19669 [Ignelater luminosus]|uniref:PHR domain-containing protein n=1 Tax=Ignelater luminosus TaxID=2038154 RepID=A0A8K0CHR7_IGNLU|nr:hypothetical protein ILUMI_19669 [Ignelater luminosus]
MGILTKQETTDICIHITANNKPALAYPTKPRTGLKSQVCHRFHSCVFRRPIELQRLGHVLAENGVKCFSDGSSDTFHVYFNNSIQIEPESFDTASAVLDGSELSYFGQEGMSEITVGTSFTGRTVKDLHYLCELSC